MKFGISMFTTDRSAGPAEVAREVEQRGFDSFWVSEHSHIPLASEPPFPGFDPRTYAAMLDPFVALTAAAAATDRIKLGTAVCLIPQHDPINCAKTVATLDRISNGRLLLGIGAGWNAEEMQNHGTDPAVRFRLMRERVEAMQALWASDEAEYHGRHVDFGPVWQWPKPVQRPHPPILVGGAGPGVLKRVVAYADGWLPVVAPEVPEPMRGRVTSLAELGQLVPELRGLAAEAGKPRPIVTVTGLPAEARILETCEALGVDRLILRLQPAGLDAVRAELDQHVAAVAAAGGSLTG
jgi:probable F420-dependent oxidoreductase